MADMYKYPVFFECPSLQLDQQKKTKNYFQTRRRSGGGDCGPLKRVLDNIYSVAFQDEKDQQRVLQKSEHVVDGLVFTVRDSLESYSSQDGLDSVLIQAFNNAVQPEQAVHQQEPELTPKRIVILGKTGYGKSSLANTILGEKVFSVNSSSSCVMSHCEAKTGSVHGRSVTVIDTPGLFDTERSEEDVKSDIMKCVTECAPGLHAFLIVLKVERFTQQEEDVIDKILKCFSEEALKYSVIVFTHGDQLDEGKKIEEFVSENKKLSDLVKKCGDRCHVFDSKYWKNNEEDNYRNNSDQVEKLLNTLDKIVMENNGGCYTNEMLQVTSSAINNVAQRISQVYRNLTREETRALAKAYVYKFLIRLSGVGAGAVVGALLGLPAMVGLMITAFKNAAVMIKYLKENELKKAAGEAGRKAVAALAATATIAGGAGGAATTGGGAAAAAAAAAATGGGAAAAATGGGAAAAAAVATGGGAAAAVATGGGAAVAVATGEAAAAAAAATAAAAAAAAGEAAAATAAAAATGEAAAGAAVGLSAAAGAGIAVAALVATAGVVGGVIGYKASDKAETPSEAAKMAAKEVCEKVKSTFKFSTKQQFDYQPLKDD